MTDQLERPTRSNLRQGAKLITIAATDLFMRSNYQDFQRFQEIFDEFAEVIFILQIAVTVKIGIEKMENIPGRRNRDVGMGVENQPQKRRAAARRTDEKNGLGSRFGHGPRHT